MKQTRLLWDMPITVEIPDGQTDDIDKIYRYFEHIDEIFSIFRSDSEISKINRGELKTYSQAMQEVLALCEQTKNETNGFFDIARDGKLNPLGLVKGWALYKAAQTIESFGFDNYYLEAGGDIQVGRNRQWLVGIRNPFNRQENIKILNLENAGVATSGTYIRGDHIYDPHFPAKKITDIVSLTVVGPNVYEADRFATAAFAMGAEGLKFIAKISGLEGYAVDSQGQATYTPGFEKYVR